MRGGKMHPGTFSERVIEIRYQHKDDGKLYKHRFGKGVRLKAEKSGEVTLSHPTKRLWGEF